MLKCTISAAGGISHLLKLGPAVILSLDKKPLITILLFLPYDSQDVSYPVSFDVNLVSTAVPGSFGVDVVGNIGHPS
jgi:hypothetical protein